MHEDVLAQSQDFGSKHEVVGDDSDSGAQRAGRRRSHSVDGHGSGERAAQVVVLREP